MISAAACAALAEVICTHPIDSAKVRLQTGRSLRNSGQWMYRGVTARLVGILPVRVVFWTTMDLSHTRLQNPMMAGAVAGACQTLVDNPVEVMKMRLMEGKSDFKWPPLSDMTRGFHWNLLRNIGFAAGVCAGREYTEHPLGAPVGAVVAAVLTHPLDTLKTQAQCSSLHHRPLFAGVVARSMLSFCTMFVGSTAYDAFLTFNV